MPVLYMETIDGNILEVQWRPTDLLDRCLEQLRHGNWQAAQFAADLVRKKQPSSSGDEHDEPASFLKELAHQCETFENEWSVESKQLLNCQHSHRTDLQRLVTQSEFLFRATDAAARHGLTLEGEVGKIVTIVQVVRKAVGQP